MAGTVLGALAPTLRQKALAALCSLCFGEGRQAVTNKQHNTEAGEETLERRCRGAHRLVHLSFTFL